MLRLSISAIDHFLGRTIYQPDVSIQFKTRQDLLPEESAAFFRFAAKSGYRLPQDYLEKQHLVHNPDLVIARCQNQLAGFYAFNLYQLQTPFAPRPLPVIYAGVGLSNPDFFHLGVGKRCLMSMYNKYLGKHWYLKTHLTMCRTINPRIIKNLYRSYTNVFPKHGQAVPQKILDFIHQFHHEQRQNNDVPDKHLIYYDERDKDLDMTSKWDQFFRVSDKKYNDMALNQLFDQVNGRIISNGNQFFIIAYYNFLDFIRKKIKG